MADKRDKEESRNKEEKRNQSGHENRSLKRIKEREENALSCNKITSFLAKPSRIDNIPKGGVSTTSGCRESATETTEVSNGPLEIMTVSGHEHAPEPNKTQNLSKVLEESLAPLPFENLEIDIHNFDYIQTPKKSDITM